MSPIIFPLSVMAVAIAIVLFMIGVAVHTKHRPVIKNDDRLGQPHSEESLRAIGIIELLTQVALMLIFAVAVMNIVAALNAPH